MLQAKEYPEAHIFDWCGGHMRKCYRCRADIKSKTKIFCKKCEGKPVKTSSTFVIFDKI